MTKRPFWLFLLVVSCFVMRLGVCHAEELHLEGIIEDQDDGRRSMAVINGNSYIVGDVFTKWRVAEIGSNFVRLVDSKGGKDEIQLTVTGPKPSPTPSSSVPPTFLNEAKKYLNNPSLVADRAWELKTIRDVALINNAAVKYYQKNGFFPTGLRQLTLDGFLPSSYESGKTSKYQFYFRNKPQQPDDFRFHADPLEPDAGLRYFFVGPDAVIRESIGKPADFDSPPHHYISKPPVPGQDS